MQIKLIILTFISIINLYGSDRDNDSSSITKYWDLPTGSHIAYAEFLANNSDTATPLIFLHGGPGGYHVSSSADEDRRARYRKLSDLGFNVYLYDQIGGGLSSRLNDPTNYTVDRHVKDLECIRVIIGNKPCILIGGSWGATLASHYISRYPANVTKAIFISPKNIDYCDLTDKPDTMISLSDVLADDLDKIHRRFGENRFKRYSKLLELMKLDIREAYSYSGDTEMDELADSLFSASSVKAFVHKKEVLKDFRSHGTGWWSFVMTGWNAIIQKSIKENLRLNKIPVLVVRGETDLIPKETALEYISVFQNSRFISIPECGHLVGLEKPQILYYEIERFLTNRSDNTVPNTNKNE